MSRLIINGLELMLTKTNGFYKEVERSRDGADIVSTKYTLDVTGILNPKATSFLATAQGPALTPNRSPAETYDAIHRILSTNRAPFSYVVGGTVVLQSPPAGATRDVAGGPTVLGVELTMLGETRTWLCRIKIETHLDDCTGYLNVPNDDPLASNRWECTHAIDDLHYTSIETRGVAVFRLDALESLDITADRLRDYCLPQIPVGFRRQHLDVSLDTRGRYLTYHCVDRQQSLSLGSANDGGAALTPARFGVVDLKASVVTSAPPMTRDGPMGFAVAGPMNVMGIQVEAAGNATANRKNLLAFCTRLAVERLDIRPGDALKNGGSVVRSVEVGESIDRQAVMLKVEVFRHPGDGNNKKNAVGLGTIWTDLIGINEYPNSFGPGANNGLPGGLAPQLPNDYNARGTWNGEILAQKMRKACDPVYLNNGCSANDGKPSDNLLDCPTIAVSPDLPAYTYEPNPSRIRSYQGILMDITVEKSVETPMSRYAAPTAGKKAPEEPAGGGDSGGTGGTGGTGSGPPPDGKQCPPGTYYNTALGLCCPVGDNGDPRPADCVNPTPSGPTKDSPGSSGGASDGGVEIMTLASPFSIVTVEWSVETIGAKPVMPAPEDPTGKLVLTRKQVQGVSMEPASDGQTLVYRRSGRYEYIAKKYVDIGNESIFFGISSFATNVPPSEAEADPGDFDSENLFQ